MNFKFFFFRIFSAFSKYLNLSKKLHFIIFDKTLNPKTIKGFTKIIDLHKQKHHLDLELSLSKTQILIQLSLILGLEKMIYFYLKKSVIIFF